ncbi:MAG: MOSC domain-containing protein [Nevskia sp.]
MALTLVGRVAALWRYPVKSMAGEALQDIEVSWHGLAGDRRWAFVQDALAGHGFPWLTIRERPAMGLLRPVLAELARPDASPVVVTLPSGRTVDIADPALAAELGGGVRAIKLNRGLFDAMPLSLVSTQTVARIGALAGMTIDARRFRPNLLIEGADGAPFAEDAWVGSLLQIGGLRLRVDQRDPRCVMINVDPDSGERNPEVLRVVARERRACLGVYGSTVQPGRIAVGDAVHVERQD